MKTFILKLAIIIFIIFISFDTYAQFSVSSFGGVQYTKVASGYRFKKHGALNATFEQTGINPDGRIFSPNRKYFLVYQIQGGISEAGKLVLYKSANNQIIWRSGSIGTGSCLMQTDGNLVIYKLSSTIYNPPSDVNPCWSSNTHGNAGAFLAIQDDGNVVIYNAANTKALWATGTNGR